MKRSGKVLLSTLLAVACATVLLASVYGARPTPAPTTRVRKTSNKNSQAVLANVGRKENTPTTTPVSRVKRVSPTPVRKTTQKRDKPASAMSSSATARSKSSRITTQTAVTYSGPSLLKLADPYGFSAVFRCWWDLTRVCIDVTYAREWMSRRRDDALHELYGIMGDVSERYERRRINMQRTAVWLYLIGRASNHSVAIPPAPSYMHKAVLRRTMVKDSFAVARYARCEESVRVSLAETLDSVQEAGISFSLDDFWKERESITLSVNELVSAWNERLIHQSVPPSLVTLIAELRALSQNEAQRFSLLSLAPPSPDMSPAYWPLVSEDLPLTVGPLPTPRTSITHERVNPPVQNAVHFRVAPGTAIHCVADGTVIFVGEVRGLDTVVIVQHELDRLSVYGHLGRVRVTADQKIREGDVVGEAVSVPGRNQVEILFEVREGSKSMSPRVLIGDKEATKLLLGK